MAGKKHGQGHEEDIIISNQNMLLHGHCPPLPAESQSQSPAINTPHVTHLATFLPLLNSTTTATAYAAALDACSRLELGQQLHAHLLKASLRRREFVQTKLLQMYGKCGRTDYMAQVFDEMPEKNLYTYTAILNVLLQENLFEEAFSYLERLINDGVGLDFFIFPAAFKICRGCGGAELGRQLHGAAVKVGAARHAYVGNALIDMYGTCRSFGNAEKAFRHMPNTDCVSWNLMIMACVRNGKLFEGIEVLDEMMNLKGSFLNPNHTTWSALIGGLVNHGYDEDAVGVLRKMGRSGVELNARVLGDVVAGCCRLRKARLGEEIYGYIMRRGYMSSTYLVNGVIDLYCKCGDMGRSFEVFLRFSGRDEVSFNTMIAGYCVDGDVAKAKALFDAMEYEGVSKGLITWNSMVSGYVDNLMFDEAVTMVTELMSEGAIEPNSFTLGSVLHGCAETGSLRLGKAVHSYCIVRGLETNLFVGTALVDMYCRCRDLEAAERALRWVPERDVVIWNALISGHARCDKIDSLRRIMQEMRDDGFEPNVHTWNRAIAGLVKNSHHELALQLFSDLPVRLDIYSVGIILPACSRLATVERGKQAHGFAIRRGYERDEYIAAALIDMYAKCGLITYAKQVYKWANNRNLVIQNAMLNAYAVNGFGEDGIAFFRRMLADGAKPDRVTFLAVLSSCVHAGSVEAGLEFLDMMAAYGVTPGLKHYTCVVDLLSGSGQLKRAHEIVEEMPVEPDPVIWGAVLKGCISRREFDLGEIAARKLIELEPDNSGNYVMLGNLYASAGKWRQFGELRQRMKNEEMHKIPGCSWIEDKDGTHVFTACSRSHKQAKEIYDMLDSLTAHMRLEQIEL
ncbi:pentatricopeptide repeat-containing protein At2g13600-like [Andrographis paniculata]|uniref:pentatricopeptide repeat-containing protein At2g13600-like n=1 Tax=Andrographis paniculata TaxID=175694 RepID=UPI0021E73D8E|nr:pentatricopeptide repeat-containing protein At2g13600-like [Andrographis paniculata]